jgi:hypothetical protein
MRLLNIPLLISLIFTLMSCGDDFLSLNYREWKYAPDTLYINNSQEKIETLVQLDLDSDYDYTVYSHPKWLSIENYKGRTVNGSILISFSIVKENIYFGFHTVTKPILLDVEDIGLVAIIVVFTNFGSPVIDCSASSINFESSDPQSFIITNSGQGILNWEIAGIPEWLVIPDTTGSLNYGESKTITAYIDLIQIKSDKDFSGTIQIIGNAINGSQTLPVLVNADEFNRVSQLSGVVTDAEYNQESGIMIISTISPNSLIIYNTNSKETRIISIGKAPKCISISENGLDAVIGYSDPSVGYIDINNSKVIRDYNIDCIPYDIVSGNNGWCYITPDDTQWSCVRNLNLGSGSLFLSLESGIYGHTILRKIYNKPYMVGTQVSSSPSGLLIFDISKGKSSDSVTYYHEDLFNYWISKDSTRLYAMTKKVYSMPKYDGKYNFTLPVVFGIIESEFYSISGIAETVSTSSIFIFNSFYYAFRNTQPGLSNTILMI